MRSEQIRAKQFDKNENFLCDKIQDYPKQASCKIFNINITILSQNFIIEKRDYYI